jgi:hypothetical protein
VVLIIVVVFIQFIVGIFNICCCNQKANPNEKQASLCMKVMMLFTFLYVVAFVLVIIYVALVIRNVQTIFCSFANIPYRILNGNTDGKSVFLGLVPLVDTLKTLSTSLGNFTTVSSNIAAINNLSLGTKG